MMAFHYEVNKQSVYKFFLILIGLFYVMSSGLHGQGINDTIIFRAEVKFFFSGKAVNGAMVRTSADTTYTNQKGNFQIRVSRRDTIFVWYPDHQEIKAPIRTFGGVEQFFLKEDQKTMLDEVVVNKQREHYLRKFVPQDTIKLYKEVKDDRIKTGDDRNYMKNMPLGVGMVSELAAQFSKKEQERRKYLDVLAEEHYSATYWKVLSDLSLKNEFVNQYGLTEDEFLDYKYYFHQTNPGLHYQTDQSRIKRAFFNQYLDYLRYYKYKDTGKQR